MSLGGTIGMEYHHRWEVHSPSAMQAADHSMDPEGDRFVATTWSVNLFLDIWSYMKNHLAMDQS